MINHSILTARLESRAAACAGLAQRTASFYPSIAAPSALLRRSVDRTADVAAFSRGLSTTALQQQLCGGPTAPRRQAWGSGAGGLQSGGWGGLEGGDDLHGELAATIQEEDDPQHQGLGGHGFGGWGSGTGEDGTTGTQRVRLVKLERPPGRFDLLTNALAYKWDTTAAEARKVSGPMREWASELKYRTGVHMEVEPSNPTRLSLPPEEGGYATADEVEISVYLFGSERGIFNCVQLMESVIDQEPAYVRLAVFRRLPGPSPADHEGSRADSSNDAASPSSSRPGDVEWLLLRRINRELRPPDIPPISLKLPGKYTLLYEQFKEAAIRSLWEETGISVEPAKVFPTGRLFSNDPRFYWRVPVHYFIAEVPYDVEVKGPMTDKMSYMRDWEPHLLRQSPDPIDRTWAASADPLTGCAWLRTPLIDELQRELRGEDYMRVRYTPPPYSELGPVVGLVAEDDA